MKQAWVLSSCSLDRYFLKTKQKGAPSGAMEKGMKMKKALAGSLIVTSLAGGIVAPAFPSLLGGEVPVVHAEDVTYYLSTYYIFLDGVLQDVQYDGGANTKPPVASELLAGESGPVDAVVTREGGEPGFEYYRVELYYKSSEDPSTPPTTDPVTPPSTDPSTPPATEVPPTTQPETETPVAEVPAPETPTTPPVTEIPTTEVPGAEAPASEAGAEAALISYDLAGGSLKGQTGTVRLEAKIGDTITLPEAPVREGYRFLHWKGSVYQPGASYTVTGPKTFTAVWEPVAAPASTSTSTPAPTTSEAEKKILPVTGEVSSLLGLFGLGLLGLAGAVKYRKSRN